MATIKARKQEAREAFAHVADGYDAIIDDLEIQNAALKQENRVLQARLEESRRHTHHTVAPAPPQSNIPPLDPVKRVLSICGTCGEFFWSATLHATYCGPCRSDIASRRRDRGAFIKAPDEQAAIEGETKRIE